MRRQFILFALLLVTSAAVAQRADTGRFEMGMGFSFGEFHMPDKPTQLSHLNGIQFDTTYNFNRWLGVTGEFTGNYSCLSGCFYDHSVSRHKAFTFAAGPRVSWRRRGFSPWTHALVGVGNTSYSNDNGVDLSSTGLAIVAGGGVDLNYGRWAIRLGQLDLLRHKVNNQMRNDLRYGVGVAIQFGPNTQHSYVRNLRED